MALVLRCASELIAVDESIAQMSRPRVHVGAFEATSQGSALPRFAIERVKGLHLHGGLRLETPLGAATVLLEDTRLQVDIEEGPFLGELALRLGYFVLTSRLGGILIHASALGLGADGPCVVACGQSGYGKSTLARLCSGYPALQVLTDEVVQIFPDGTAGGTPFRSDMDNVGRPGLRRAKYFVALRKAAHEALEPLETMTAVTLGVAQAFEPHAYALPRVEARRRLMQFLSAVELGTLAFRKDPAVGPFVASQLSGSP